MKEQGPLHQRIKNENRDIRLDLLWGIGALIIVGLAGVASNFFIAYASTPAVLGIFNQAFAIYLIFSQVAIGGIHLSALKYSSQHAFESDVRRRIAMAATLLALSLSSIVAWAVWNFRLAIADVLGSPGVSDAIVFVSPALILFSLNKVQLALVNAARHMKMYAFCQALRGILLVLTIAILILLGAPGEQLAAAFCVAEGALALVVLPYVHFRVASLRFEPGWQAWVRQHAAFGARAFLGGLLTEMTTRIDVLLLGIFHSDSIVGIYSLAAILAEGLAQIPVVIRSNLDPLFGRFFSGDLRSEATALIRTTQRRIVPALFLITLLSVGVFWTLVQLIEPLQAFRSSLAPYAVLALGVVVSSYQRPFLGIFTQAGRPELYSLVLACSIIINTFVALLLVPTEGALGAAFAAALALCSESALIGHFRRRFLRLQS